MNKDYTIYFKEERTFSSVSKIGIYLVPHGVEIKSNSLFRLRIGFIDLDDNPLVFHCIDSDRMTIEVMESIIYQWKEWETTREKTPY